MNPPTDSQVNDAISVLTRDYYSDVQSVANTVALALKDGEIENRDSLLEFVHKVVDNNQRVIYTFQAKCGLLVSENADAADDEFGEVDGKKMSVEARMSCAMERDVFEHLGNQFNENRIDVNDDNNPLFTDNRTE